MSAPAADNVIKRASVGDTIRGLLNAIGWTLLERQPPVTPSPQQNAPQRLDEIVFSPSTAKEVALKHGVPAPGHGLTREQVELIAAQAEMQERFGGQYAVWIDDYSNNDHLQRTVLYVGGSECVPALGELASEIDVDAPGSVGWDYVDPY